MARGLVLAVLLFRAAAFAQEAGGKSAGPGERPRETVVTGSRDVSPIDTQERMFPGTRLWRLDTGHVELETWGSAKAGRDGTIAGLWQLELGFGLTRHVQIDVYQNLAWGTGVPSLELDSTSLEARISLGTRWNEYWGNPVLYLEWITKKFTQDRAEARLLLGGDTPWGGYWAVNLYAESNVTYFHLASAEGTDGELGATAATNVSLVPERLKVGLEARAGVDQHGEPAFFPSAFVGPNATLLVREARLRLSATWLVGLFPKDPAFRPFVVLSFSV